MNTNISIHLTKPQQNKARKGLAFQVTPAQLKLQPNTEISISLKAIKKLMRAKDSGKGYRFKAGDYKMVEHNDAVDVGGSFLLPSGGSFRLAGERGDDLYDVGGKIGFKNPIVKAVGKKAIAITANQLNKKGVINDNQEDGINILADNLINSKNQQQSIDTINGMGIKRPAKLIKGDPATIAYMRSIRNMKKTEGGKIFGDKAMKIIKPIKHAVLQPNVALALSTGNPYLVGSVIAKNGYDDFTASKYAKNNVPRPVLSGMKLVSDDTNFGEGIRGGNLNTPQPIGSGENIRLNLARKDLYRVNRPKKLVEGSGFINY